MINMVTKHDLLEEKTVKDLRQMARDKNLSGYSNMRKDELIEFIGENYKKKEIRTWPNFESEELETKETEGKNDSGDGGKRENHRGEIEPEEGEKERPKETPEPQVKKGIKSPDKKMILVVAILMVIMGVSIAVGI